MATAQNLVVPNGGTGVLYVPDACVGVPSPCMIVFHGRGGTGGGMQGVTGFNAIADSNPYCPFVVFYADSLSTSGWTFTGTPSDCSNLEAAVAYLAAQKIIDPTRLYLFGYSEGAGMAGQACVVLGDAVWGVVQCAENSNATTWVPNGKPKFPVTVVLYHGTQDPISAFDGGNVHGGKTKSAVETAQEWASIVGIAASTPVTTTNDTTTTQVWSDTPDGTSVTLYSGPWGHVVPGGGQTGNSTLGPQVTSPQACRQCLDSLP